MDERVTAGVKTIEAARALQEIDFLALMGSPLAGPLATSGIAGDDIIMFVDADGRAMQVVETAEGPRKMELRL